MASGCDHQLLDSAMAGNGDCASLGPIDVFRYMDSLWHPPSLTILIDYVKVKPKKRQSGSGLHGNHQKKCSTPHFNPKSTHGYQQSLPWRDPVKKTDLRPSSRSWIAHLKNNITCIFFTCVYIYIYDVWYLNIYIYIIHIYKHVIYINV